MGESNRNIGGKFSEIGVDGQRIFTFKGVINFSADFPNAGTPKIGDLYTAGLSQGIATGALTSSAGVATVVVSDKVFDIFIDGDDIQILEADQAEYNGIFVGTKTVDNKITYPIVGTPASPATGNIIIKYPLSVTDNDPAKTNTGQTIYNGTEFFWTGDSWEIAGEGRLFSDTGLVLQPINPRDINIAAGQIYSIDGVNIDEAVIPVSQIAEVNTGFLAWTSGTDADTYTVDGTGFQVDRSGAGNIRSQFVTWVAGQKTAPLAANKTSYIYIDSAGALQATTTASNSFYEDNIVLFECLFDSANYVVVKENHPYDFQTSVSNYLHDNVGTVIQGVGANVTRVAAGTGASADDRRIKIVGADVLEDHGLKTAISELNPGTWEVYYTDNGGNWIRDSQASELPMLYSNAGVATAITNNQRSILVLYVSKDDIESATPTYFAVMDNAEYSSLVLAEGAITNNTLARATNELAELEFAQLGYAIVRNNASGGYIEELIVEKDTFNTRTVGGGQTVNHNLLDNKQLAGADVTYGHINDTVQTIAGAKTFSDTVTVPSIDMINAITEFSIDGTFAADSDAKVPTEKAIGTYIATAALGILRFKGTITLAVDFPTLAEVQIGWFYIIEADVTDDDAAKTNTGQSFLAGQEIVWNGSTWSALGENSLLTDNTVDLTPTDARGFDIATGEEYKINGVNINNVLEHDSFANTLDADAGVAKGHINDTAQTIAGDKTLTGNNIYNGGSSFGSSLPVIINSDRAGVNLQVWSDAGQPDGVMYRTVPSATQHRFWGQQYHNWSYGNYTYVLRNSLGGNAYQFWPPLNRHFYTGRFYVGGPGEVIFNAGYLNKNLFIRKSGSGDAVTYVALTDTFTVSSNAIFLENSAVDVEDSSGVSQAKLNATGVGYHVNKFGFNTKTPNTAIDNQGGLTTKVTNISAAGDYYLTEDDYELHVDTAAGVVNIIWPTLQVVAGRAIRVIDVGAYAGTNRIYVKYESGTIAYTLKTNSESITLNTNGIAIISDENNIKGYRETIQFASNIDLTGDHVGKALYNNTNAALTITVTDAFNSVTDVGATVDIYRFFGSAIATVQILWTGSQIIKSRESSINYIANPGSTFNYIGSARLTKIANNNWMLSGDISPTDN